MPQPDPIQSLHAAVRSYLTLLLEISEAVATACPAVGGPYQHRLARLRTRLSYDTNREALEASATFAQAELRDFAGKAATYLENTEQEWHGAAADLRASAEEMLTRQDAAADRLRDVIQDLKTAPYPEDSQKFSELVDGHAASLGNLLDALLNDSGSILAQIDQRLSDAVMHLERLEVVDLATGLMNRREMERRISEREEAGSAVIRLLFSLEWDGPSVWRDPILRQASARLSAQLRPDDLIGRWANAELLALFNGPEEIAVLRGDEVAERMSGPYAIDGSPVLVQAHVQCLDRQAAEPEAV